MSMKSTDSDEKAPQYKIEGKLPHEIKKDDFMDMEVNLLQ